MSRFVSGGTIDEPVERDDEWAKAQQELEEARRRREEEAGQQDGRSLFEILQANKVAKQEAFEEAHKLKNQFRALDDEEVEFLDSVLESTRAAEAAIRKETTEKLDIFRKQREEAEKAALEDQSGSSAAIIEEEQWIASGSRKRKKGKEREPLLGLKLRKTSSTSEKPQAPSAVGTASSGPPPLKTMNSAETAKAAQSPKSSIQPTQSSTAKVTPAKLPIPAKSSPSTSPPSLRPKTAVLGLTNYSSDSDE
ncbi:hypothetical protein K432DRAFT_382005 [Lepidopterella palustris CBS 459.81]|uniref:FAM192A/Fyv6 N-terminal domain-containing protein n=1 Tax=Lepidopterella palustris CBS 459.81 TaxID=1314670 RepID=A0A8E2JG24_9PEZI|nr:hypothetical protein K432DRAFT_382005 [Lepidopterella palustris CBS 459.81]